MKFVCDRCHTRYSISDEKVKGKVLKIRCKTCGNIIVVREQGAASAAESARGPAPRTEVELPRAAVGGAGSVAAPPSSNDDIEWFVAIKGQQHGPMKHGGIVQMLQQGQIHDRSYCWHENLAGWTRMRDLPEFQAAIRAGAAAPPPAAKAPPVPPPDDESGAQVVSLEAHRQQRQSGAKAPEGPVTVDPFAAVTQGAPAVPEGAPRESTRVFIMNAGLHNRSAKHKTYAVAASVAFFGLVGLCYLDYSGIVQIPLLNRLVSAAAEASGVEPPKRRKLLAAFNDSDSDDDMQCKLLGNCAKPEAKTKRRRRKAGGGLDDEFGDDAFQTGGPAGSNIGRAGSGDALDIDPGASNAADSARLAAMLKGGLKGPKKVRVKPGKIKTIDVSGGTGLEPAKVARVVNGNLGAVKTCVEEAAKKGSSVGGKQVMVLTVLPKGFVRQARIKNAVVNASPLGECITKRARKWKFPAFVGEPFDIEVPLILTTGY